MDMIFTEEHKHYQLDCSKALWATDEVHQIYHSCNLSILCDVDFIIETEEKLILVEYKNWKTKEAVEHRDVFDVKDNKLLNKLLDKIPRKYFDTLHYLSLKGKTKPKHYVYILECPNDDSAIRKYLRNLFKARLPFKLQEMLSDNLKLIESVEVLSIDEWNRNSEYGVFPLIPIENN
jgi:hypothetical protein